jgi:hypothetical protein
MEYLLSKDKSAGAIIMARVPSTQDDAALSIVVTISQDRDQAADSDKSHPSGISLLLSFRSPDECTPSRRSVRSVSVALFWPIVRWKRIDYTKESSVA